MNKNQKNIVVVGTGAFGTSIADNLILNEKNKVILYGVDELEIEDINVRHKNSKYYSRKLNVNLKATSKAAFAFNNADIIVLGLPSSFVRDVVQNVILKNMIRPAYFVNLSKGIDYLKVELISDILQEIIPPALCLGIAKLSGPSFADEVLWKQPTLFTLATKSKLVFQELKPHFEGDSIRIESNFNLRGIEAISVMKNPLAIILGIVKGLGYKRNASAFMFTKCVDEIKQMMKLFDIENIAEVITSSAGIGDLLLTGTSLKSRNFHVGYKIGKSNQVTKKILSSFTTTEGLRSLELIISIAQRKKINLPLIEMLYNITYKRNNPAKTVEEYFRNN